MSVNARAARFSAHFKIDRQKKSGDCQRGQTLVEYGIFVTGIVILGILVGGTYFFSSRSSCERSALTNAECDAVAVAGFPYADAEYAGECFTFQDSLQTASCQNDSDCLPLPGIPRGSYNSESDVEVVVIEDDVMHYLFESRSTIDGCYDVTINGANVTWESKSSCEEIQQLQLWNIPLCNVD